MINIEVMKEVEELCDKYEKRWNIPLDFVGLPSTLWQEKFLLIMRLIVNTGDSILVGNQKVSKILKSYCEYLNSIEENIKDGEIVEKVCPFCGEKVRFYENGKSYEFRCDTVNCIKYGSRGI